MQPTRIRTLVVSFSTLAFSTIMSIFSRSWLVIWILLELNTLSYCLMCFKETSKEAMLKYFIVQTIASALLIFGSLMIPSLIILALILKLASAPFHYWFIDVCKKRSWVNNKILLTWQKLLPTLLTSYTAKGILIFFITASALVGSIFIINKKSLKEILALSSVFNLRWILVTITFNLKILLILSLVYWIALLIFIKRVTNNSNKTVVFISTITLAGIPPFMFFVAKWQVLTLMLKQQIAITSTLLLILRSVNAFVYLRWSSVDLLKNTNNIKIKSYEVSYLMLINLLFLLF